MKLLKLFFLFPFIACANANVPNILTAIAMLICAMPAYAEDWSGTDWEVVQEGKCYPSTEVFMKSVFGDNYLEDENIKIGEWYVFPGGEYYIAGDHTPSRGWSSYIIQKEKMNKVCIIAYLLGEGGSVEGNFSATGTLLELKTLEYAPTLDGVRGDYYNIEIVYKPDKKGRFFPSQCIMSGEKKRKSMDCRTGRPEPDPLPIPPSFGCTNYGKLNPAEYAVCSDSVLAELDSVLAKNYKALQAANIGEIGKKLTRDQ